MGRLGEERAIGKGRCNQGGRNRVGWCDRGRAWFTNSVSARLRPSMTAAVRLRFWSDVFAASRRTQKTSKNRMGHQTRIWECQSQSEISANLGKMANPGGGGLARSGRGGLVSGSLEGARGRRGWWEGQRRGRKGRRQDGVWRGAEDWDWRGGQGRVGLGVRRIVRKKGMKMGVSEMRVAISVTGGGELGSIRGYWSRRGEGRWDLAAAGGRDSTTRECWSNEE